MSPAVMDWPYNMPERAATTRTRLSPPSPGLGRRRPATVWISLTTPPCFYALADSTFWLAAALAEYADPRGESVLRGFRACSLGQPAADGAAADRAEPGRG